MSQDLAQQATSTTTRSQDAESGLRAVTAVLAIALLVSCGSPPRPSHNTAAASPSQRISGSPQQLANAVLFRAIGLVGTPYHWGGNTPDSGFDCSGLVGFVFRDAAGLSLPRTSAAMAALNAPKIKRGQLKSGDLVFFASGRRIDHVGIYVGNGRFVHAPNSGGTVRLDAIDGAYWGEHFRFARRPIH